MAIASYKADGSKATAAPKLDDKVFGVAPASHDLLKSVYSAYLANGRTNNALTKKRGEVSGGGKKPWRQKGTGRARFGSSRNPIWRGGGIAFGPTGQENYSKAINVKAKRLALRQALSLAKDAGKIRVIETFSCEEGKVKQTRALLDKIDATRRVLLVVSVKDELVHRATRNIGSLSVVQANYLNVYDVLNADTIVFSQRALDSVTDLLTRETSSAGKAAKPATQEDKS